MSGANLVQMLMVAALFSFQVVVALHLQKVLGYGAAATGLAMLPAAVAIGAVSLGLSARLSARLGERTVMTASVAVRSVMDHPERDECCLSAASSAYGPKARRRSAGSRYSTPVMPRAVAASMFSWRSSTNRHRRAGTPARSAAMR